MPKCELCGDFEAPKTGSIGWCKKFNEPRKISDSCNEGEVKEDAER